MMSITEGPSFNEKNWGFGADPHQIFSRPSAKKIGQMKELTVSIKGKIKKIPWGSVLSPLLFLIVMEAVTREVREGLPWELLYADDLVLVAESWEELKEKLIKWKSAMEKKGLITRESIPRDARLKRLVLTEKGMEFQMEIMENFDRIQDVLKSDIPQEKLECFLEVLDMIRENAQRECCLRDEN